MATGPAAKVRNARLIVEPEDAHDPSKNFLTMDDTGLIRYFRTARAVVRWVKQRDRDAAREGVCTVTAIEWRCMPPNFVPPEA